MRAGLGDRLAIADVPGSNGSSKWSVAGNDRGEQDAADVGLAGLVADPGDAGVAAP